MKIHLRSIILVLAVVAFATGARAQYIWRVVHTDQIADTQYSFQSVSCSGNNCTVGAMLTDQSTYEISVLFYRSRDGGRTWFWQKPDIAFPFTFSNAGFAKIQQIDSLNIVAIGDSGLVVRTFNGGETWERQSSPIKIKLSDVHFSDPMTGIITGAGEQEVIITSDGGRHWEFATLPGHFYVQCHSYGGRKFRIFQYKSGRIYTTVDNFKTVTVTDPAIDSLVPRSYAYIPARCAFGGGDTLLAYGAYYQKDTVVAFGTYGLIVRSVDGGAHWEKPHIFPTEFIAQIDCTTQMDRDTVIAMGIGNPNILLSTDRGYSWKVDSLLLDTTYSTSAANGISMTGDGCPIAVRTPAANPTSQAIIVRGERTKANVYDMIAYQSHIYPNPSARIVNISSIDVSRPVFVYDLLGREVLKGMLSQSGKITFDFKSLPPSLYCIILNHNGKMIPVGKVAVIGR